MSGPPGRSLRGVLRGLANNEAIDWEGLSGALRPSHAALLPELQAIWQIGRAHASEPEPGAPETWGDLRVLSRLGGGSFGDVYRAWDPHLAREVALKILKARDPQTRDRGVVAEGHLLTRVRHPNVVTVLGASRVEGQVGFWMELVDGTTLEDVGREWGPLTATEVAEIGRQLCAGVQALHDAGLVHGDIKPQNVMRDASGRIVLMDLGAAHDLQARRDVVAATPRYMAPEIAHGHLPDPCSDVYSVGVLLHRLATGRYPDGSAVPTGPGRDDVALHRALARACASSRAARPASASELADMLARVKAAPDASPRARMRARLATGVLAVAVSGAIGVLVWSQPRGGSQPAVPTGSGVFVGQVDNQLEPVTTRSLVALQLYSRAYALGERDDWQSALALVRDALDEQPQFPAARIWLAWALENTRAPKASVLAEARAALAGVQTASLWERRWIRGSYHLLAGEYEAAIPEYLALIQLRPDIVWSYSNLMFAYRALGRDTDLPSSLVVSAAENHPHSLPLNVMAINVLLRQGQFDAAERHAARVRASATVRPLRPGLPVIRAVLLPAETALRRGDVATALAALQSLESATLFEQPQPLPVTIELFWFYLRMGRTSDAERMLDRITPLRDGHLYGALLAYFSGDSSRLRHELAGAMVDRPDGDGQWPVLAWLQVQAGDLADARRSNERATAPTRASTSGHILLAERRYDEAIKALSSDVRALGPGMYWRSLIGLAQAWAAKGDHTRAAATLGTLEDSEATFTPMNHPVFRAQAYLTLSEAYLQLDRPASARRILDHLRGTLAASEPRFVLKQRLEVLTARLDGP